MTDTYAATAPGEKLLVKFGSGGGAQTFTHACSINTDRSIEFSTDSSSTAVPNCTDPSKPAKMVRRVKSNDVKVTGAGITDLPSFKVLLKLWLAGQPVDMQIEQDDDANGWLVEGPFIIDNIKTGAASKEEQTFDISLSAADAFDITFP
jgi:predicted secreted protein